MNDIDKRLEEISQKINKYGGKTISDDIADICFLFSQLKSEREEKERLEKAIEVAAKELNDDFSQSELGNELFPVWHKLDQALKSDREEEDHHENHVADHPEVYHKE